MVGGNIGAVLPLSYLATKAEILLLGLRGLPVLFRGVNWIFWLSILSTRAGLFKGRVEWFDSGPLLARLETSAAVEWLDLALKSVLYRLSILSFS